jgi:hypothetical protein
MLEYRRLGPLKPVSAGSPRGFHRICRKMGKIWRLTALRAGGLI